MSIQDEDKKAAEEYLSVPYADFSRPTEQEKLEQTFHAGIAHGRTTLEREYRALRIAAMSLCHTLINDGDHSDLVNDLYELTESLSHQPKQEEQI
jgi:hypothetical protein